MTEKISRASFLKISAGAIVGASLLSFPKMSFAATPKARAAAFNNLPEAQRLAKESDLVQLSYKKIKDAVNTIQDARLRSMTMDIINDPNPTFMQQYQSPAAKAKVYDKLVALKLIDPAKTSLQNFLPRTA